MKKLFSILLFVFFLSSPAWAQIPATPVMTFYQFSGSLEIPYYSVETFQERGATAPAGTLAQGSSIVPCLVIRNGKPLTDAGGTPFVGFQVVVDARTATRDSTEKFKAAVADRQSMTVPNHHCDGSVKYVVNIRDFFPLEKAPFFDPPRSTETRKREGHAEKRDSLDEIVRAFHNSPQCAEANRELIGRRNALATAWDRFIAENRRSWPEEKLDRAKQLDYTMRTAIYEGHLDRGCGAYGACERNIVALSISNRGRSGCSRSQGCSFPGDFQGVSAKVSQYNIWDEFLTQISGLSSCFLRSDLSDETSVSSGEQGFNKAYYEKIRSMYEQNVGDVEQILFGDDQALTAIFPQTPLNDLKTLRHYYHAPAMGKCFPDNPRVEYVTGVIAKKGDDYALIANTRIQVDEAIDGGYRFREFRVKAERDRDVTSVVDAYPGFVVDGRKIDLKGSSGCPPYGIPRGCAYKDIGRYRRLPSWLHAGRPVAIQCNIRERGEQCLDPEKTKAVSVGGTCDTEMRPVSGVR